MDIREIDNLFAGLSEIAKQYGCAGMQGKAYPKQPADVRPHKDGYLITPLNGYTNLRFFVNDKGGKIFDIKGAETYNLDIYETLTIKNNYMGVSKC